MPRRTRGKSRKIKKAELKLLQERYDPHINCEGGIFSSKYRQRLLRISGVSGRAGTLVDFRHDIRKYVKNALVDLALFVETADEDDVNKTITVGALEPFGNSFFHIAFPDQASPERAGVAAFLVRKGLDYLSRANIKHMTDPNKTAIDHVVNLVVYFAANVERGENR